MALFGDAEFVVQGCTRIPGFLAPGLGGKIHPLFLLLRSSCQYAFVCFTAARLLHGTHCGKCAWLNGAGEKAEGVGVSCPPCGIWADAWSVLSSCCHKVSVMTPPGYAFYILSRGLVGKIACCVVLCGGQYPCVTTQHLKWGRSEVSCAVSVKYTPGLGLSTRTKRM